MTTSTKKTDEDKKPKQAMKSRTVIDRRRSDEDNFEAHAEESLPTQESPEANETDLARLEKEGGSTKGKFDDLLVLAKETRRDSNADRQVAPFIKPEERLKQAGRNGAWKKRGFVELSPGKSKLRHRILPRTVIGISFMLLAVAVGMAFSGAAFYAYYDNRLAENEQAVERFVDGFDQQFNDAAGAIDELRVDAVEDIRTELQPMEGIVTDAEGVINLPVTAGPSVWGLETNGEAGEPVAGSAFAILEHENGTILMTSHSLITASTAKPSPALTLTKGDQRVEAELWSWDEDNDLALVFVTERIPVLPLANANDRTASVGLRVFAMSGFGGQGATASPGILLDQSLTGLQHTAPVGSMFEGGPVLNGAGKVVGLASLSYQPTGTDPGMVLTAPDSASFCSKVLRCAEIDSEITLEVVVEGEIPETDSETPAESDSEAEQQDN